MTDAEKELWRHLRKRQLNNFKFRRQHPFGDYILDFVCLEAMLVVELDGGQHATQVDADSKRTLELNKAGFRVLRFWNNEVLNNIEGVVESILVVLHKKTPPPSLPSP